jgi:3-hydroxyacyl-[acyl-carrier-protein] dehydratase
MTSTAPLMTIEAILARLPHRYPCLLVDRVDSIEPGRAIRARKNVTVNEPYFQGHFPRFPVMPGVLIVEALAQAATLLIAHSAGAGAAPRLRYLALPKIKFRRQVLPGDVLHLEVDVVSLEGDGGSFAVRALVGGEIALEAEMTLAAAR